MGTYKPPLALHFVWNIADNESVDKILTRVKTSFARDAQRPFSRGLNIPLFFYNSTNPCQAPEDQPAPQATKDIVFVFTSVNTLGRERWKSYIDKLSEGLEAVPIAMDQYGLGHAREGRLKDLNFLRAYDWERDFKEQYAILAITHEIYRHGFVKIKKDDTGKCSSIKIFLSHSKTDGLQHAKSIYKFIDDTNMRRFFDTTDIAPSFNFTEEIKKHIEESTLIAIGSDTYSSRYWCQREILYAKEKQRPIIAVNCLQNFEDRVFPAAANVPCMHVSPNTPLNKADILRILIATMLETIRYLHARKSLKCYGEQGWIEKSCTIYSRPPEIDQIIHSKREKENSESLQVCYPEPPLYSEETSWLKDLNVDAFTPLLTRGDDSILYNFRIGISVSDSPIDSYSKYHLSNEHLQRLSQDLARHLLARAGTIIYGGDLRDDGFTQFILDEAIALRNHLKSDHIHVENHLAWPLHLQKGIVSWKAKYDGVIKTIEHEIPDDIKKDSDEKTFLAPKGIENLSLWVRCLTKMREASIESSDVRICAGGRFTGYKGKMPGVLEEIMISVEKEKPIFLLGAFGGVVSAVCKTIKEKSIAESLTEDWQIKNNAGYSQLQEKAKQKHHHADYSKIKNVLENLSSNCLAKRAGLEEEEYQRLMNSPFIDECVYLILKGLKGLRSSSKKPKNPEHDKQE